MQCKKKKIKIKVFNNVFSTVLSNQDYNFENSEVMIN